MSSKVEFCLLSYFTVYVDSLLCRLEQCSVSCRIGGHFVGALAYADDVTLVGPSRSGIRTLINVCEQFALHYDITFNGTKSQLMHLGHSISSSDRTEIVKYSKISFWCCFNIFRADFAHISSRLKNVLFPKYCCVFYGSPLWPPKCAMIQSLCVDWRKALRCVWSINNRTHGYIITSLSNQFPLILNLKKRFVKFIRNSLVC